MMGDAWLTVLVHPKGAGLRAEVRALCTGQGVHMLMDILYSVHVYCYAPKPPERRRNSCVISPH